VTSFAFVHGSWHDPWCFDTLREVLAGEGLESVAPDLPVTDPAAGCPEYADVMAEAIGDARDVVLVAHSSAGLTAPLVAERRQLERMVLLGGLVPEPGHPAQDDFQDPPMPLTPEGRKGRATDAEGRSRWADLGQATEVLYHDCDAATTAEALARLRPQGQRPMTDPCPLSAWPEVDTTYVVCTDDRMVSTQWSRSVGVPRANAELAEIPGGHSPMLSRPRELADLLIGLAA
jgi:pimeloyl-ACP methyl ester carboxylesterase